MTYIVASDKNYITLKFKAPVLTYIADMALMSSNKILFESILNSILSSSFKHSFLELYRLIERLFPVNYLKELHQKVNTPLTFLEFSGLIEDVTSWRPREEDAVEKIFKETKDSILEVFNQLLMTQPEFNGYSKHKYFYKLRNTIVHFRANHQEMLLDDDQWNSILHATLELIDVQYSKNHALL